MSFSNNNQDSEFNRNKEEFSLADKNSSQNPFLENANANKKNNTAQADYEITNERIKDNKKQNKGLAKILLALLLASGIIIVSILGLIGKNKAAIAPNQNISAWDSNDNNKTAEKSAFKWPWQKAKDDSNLPNNSNSSSNSNLSPTQNNSNNSENTNSPASINPETNKAATLNPSSALPVAATNNTVDEANKPEVCKLSEAQKYISESVNNLDRVVGLAENKLDTLNASTLTNKAKEAEFLKNKVNDLSKAESDIYAFSEAHLDRDSSNINMDDYSASCAIEDGPKYLNAWLDQLSERIKSLDAELSYLSSPEVPVANTMDNNTIANNNIDQIPPLKPIAKAEIPKEKNSNVSQNNTNLAGSTSPEANNNTKQKTSPTATNNQMSKDKNSSVNVRQNNTKQKTSPTATNNQMSKDKNSSVNLKQNNTNSIVSTSAEVNQNNTKNINQKNLAQAQPTNSNSKTKANNLNTSNNSSAGNLAKNNSNSQKQIIKPKQKIIPNYISIVPPKASSPAPEYNHSHIQMQPKTNLRPERRIISRCDNGIGQQPVQDNYYQNLPIRRCTSDYDQHEEPEYYYEEYAADEYVYEN